nr:serine/arginine repetitive matrix protein 1-like isoform X1 [Cherax quadricarinatus]
MYSSSPADSPKHSYSPPFMTRHTYTSPPGSPKRGSSPVPPQSYNSSPYSSPKRSLSAPNSPQRSVRKELLSPRSIFRLWQNSSRKNNGDNKSLRPSSPYLMVDNNRDAQHNEREIKMEDKTLRQHVRPEHDIRIITPENGTVSDLCTSKQSTVPQPPSRELSSSPHLQRQGSLPTQTTQYSHPCHPSILGSYLQIYRQSSLPEEDMEESLHSSSVTTSDQQLYRWITRQSQPPQPLTCPYDELFKQASMQESRYKSKPIAQRTHSLPPETNENNQNFINSLKGVTTSQSKESTKPKSEEYLVNKTSSQSNAVFRQASLPETSSLSRSPQRRPPPPAVPDVLPRRPSLGTPSQKKLLQQNSIDRDPQQQERDTPTPPQLQRDTPTPPQLQRDTPTPPQLQRDTPTPPQLHRDTPTPPQQQTGKKISPQRTPPPLPPNKPKYIPKPSESTSQKANIPLQSIGDSNTEGEKESKPTFCAGDSTSKDRAAVKLSSSCTKDSKSKGKMALEHPAVGTGGSSDENKRASCISTSCINKFPSVPDHEIPEPPAETTEQVPQKT